MARILVVSLCAAVAAAQQCSAQIDLSDVIQKPGFKLFMRGDAADVMVTHGFGCCGSPTYPSPPAPSARDVIESLGAVQHLQRLTLEGSHMSEEQFLSLHNLTEVKHLDIRRTYISVAGLVAISKLRDLEEIAIGPPVYDIDVDDKHPECKTFRDADVSLLSTLPKLKTVIIEGNPLTSACVSHFAKCRALRVARLSIGSLDIRDVTHLQQITELDVHGARLINGSLVTLRDMPQLEVLRLPQELPSIHELGMIAGLPRLRVLDLSRIARLDAKSLAKVSDAKGIESLSIQVGRVDDAGLKYLGKMQSLKHLEMVNVPSATAKSSLAVVSTLPNLDALRITGAGITDAVIDDLLTLKHLKRLILEQTRIYGNPRDMIKKSMPETDVEFR